MKRRLAFLGCLTLGILTLSSDGVSAPQSADEPRPIEVLARRFTFEPSTIEVTEGERVRLVVTSGDGVHGIEIKKFRVNKEIPRGGDPVIIDFTASEAGRFPIICSAFCGDGHGDMKGMLIVLAREKDQ
jgi:cytochrome c oxidase subunit 2